MLLALNSSDSAMRYGMSSRINKINSVYFAQSVDR